MSGLELVLLVLMCVYIGTNIGWGLINIKEERFFLGMFCFAVAGLCASSIIITLFQAIQRLCK